MWSAPTALVLGLLASSHVAQAVFRPALMMQMMDKVDADNFGVDAQTGLNITSGTNGITVDLETVELPIDHFGNMTGTFANRHWIMDQYYKPGGPVFLYDAGEADAEPGALTRLTSPNSFFNELVAEFNGIGIVWEHRYYGKSAPFNISLDTPPEEMQYLTAQQALADVPYFAKQFSRPAFPTINLTPSGTPWIFVGGSYPGMRAAFMRELYPETIFASWSASAPVEARVDMSVYFEQVYRGLQHYGWGNCTKNIQGAVKYIDGEMGKNSTANAAIKNFMFGPGGSDNSNEGVADAMSYIFYSFQSYGVEGSLGSLRSFCDWISTDETGAVAPAEGWEPTKGTQWLATRWATWSEWTDVVNNYTPTNCAGHNGTATADTKCQLDLAFPDPASVSWTWQYCTTWGFFQSSNFGPNRIGSRYNTLKHQQEICYRQFPTGLSSGLLPATPEVHKINQLTGGWRERPSRTMLNGGEFDPWRTLSILSNESFAPKGVVVSQDIPECDAKGDANKIFGYLLPDAEHCFDMRKIFPGSAAPRALFKAALTKWLPCFAPTA